MCKRPKFVNQTVMCPSHSCRVRVTSLSSQSHQKNFRVESQELASHFELFVCKLESISSHTKFHVFSTTFFAMKCHSTCYKKAPDKLEIVPNVVWTSLIFLAAFNVLTTITAYRGGARGVPGVATVPPKFCRPPPVAPPKTSRFLSESPSQNIDSSPCCKIGPSSAPPNENVWLRPWLPTTCPCINV